MPKTETLPPQTTHEAQATAHNQQRKPRWEKTRKVIGMIAPGVKVGLYQERDLRPDSPAARAAQAMDALGDLKDAEGRLRGRRPGSRKQVERMPDPGDEFAPPTVRVRQEVKIRLDRHGEHNKKSNLDDLEAHAFARNPMSPDNDIREINFTRLSARDPKTGAMSDRLVVSVVSRQTPEYHADGSLKTSTGWNKSFARFDTFTMDAGANGEFGPIQHELAVNNSRDGYHTVTGDRVPDQAQAGENFAAIMGIVEGIDFSQQNPEGTFAPRTIQADTIAHHHPLMQQPR